MVHSSHALSNSEADTHLFPTRVEHRPIFKSRRDMLRVLLAASVAVCAPGRIRAVEPITILQAAAAVVGIVAGLSGMASDASLRRGINQILARLDQVVANQELLLEELRSLRIYIDEALRRSWRDAYARNIASYNDSLKVYFADLEANKWVMTTRLRKEFEDLSKDCATTTYSIGQMDVWAYPSFATGVIVVLLSDRALRSSPERVAETKRNFVKYIDQWLNPAIPTSLPSIIVQTAAEITDRTNKLNSKQKVYVLSDRRVESVDNDRYCSERVIESLTVSGSLEAGYTGTTTTATSDKRCQRIVDPCPRLCIVSMDENVAGIEGRIARRREGGTSVLTLIEEPISVPVVPGFTPSAHAIVDTFNRERVAIYELMAANARQKLLKQEMEKMKNSLS